jgi:hypothetical protein
MNRKITTTILTSLVVLMLPFISLAVGDDIPTNQQTEICESSGTSVCLNVPIGGVKKLELKDGGFATYVQLWYSFVVGAVGIMATVMIMYAGFKWLASRGNAGVISDAKDKIWSAIIGLFLVFASYIILNVINGDLLDIGLPQLPQVNIGDTGDGGPIEINSQYDGDVAPTTAGCCEFNLEANRVCVQSTSPEDCLLFVEAGDDFSNPTFEPTQYCVNSSCQGSPPE